MKMVKTQPGALTKLSLDMFYIQPQPCLKCLKLTVVIDLISKTDIISNSLFCLLKIYHFFQYSPHHK